MIATPDSAACRTLLADGRIATVRATRRPRAGRAELKCQVPDAPAVAERMQQVLRLARHSEAALDLRDQVMFSIDPAPGPQERDWELAAVLADRMVRGLVAPDAALLANGWSLRWQQGRIDGHDQSPQGALLGGELGHLGALAGHPDPGAAVATARAWFPLHSGGVNDSLAWVEVSVRPLQGEAADDTHAISIVGADIAVQDAAREALLGARHFDACAPGRWRTTVRFSSERFNGRSFELALVMADRMARGREFQPRGRLIASGCSAAWHTGRVDSVEAANAKCALIARSCQTGDRVLLPRAWRAGEMACLQPALQVLGASVAWVERIGIL